jgi:hypothetical protein
MFSRGILAKLILLDLSFSDHLLKVGERVIKTNVIQFGQGLPICQAGLARSQQPHIISYVPGV